MALLSGISASNRYGLAIASIAVNYVIAGGAHGATGAAWAVLSGFLTIWLVFNVSEAPKARRLAAVAIPVSAGAAILVTVLGESRHETPLETALILTNMFLYLIAPVAIVRHIFARSKVDVQTMYGAVAAYLLIGMMFAYAYKGLGQIQVNPPLFGEDGHGSMPQVLFFSFVTLTTTGYGNLVPAGNPAQTMAVMEAIIGQLFLVTAVAKVVTAWHLPAERKTRDRLINEFRNVAAGNAHQVPVEPPIVGPPTPEAG